MLKDSNREQREKTTLQSQLQFGSSFSSPPFSAFPDRCKRMLAPPFCLFSGHYAQLLLLMIMMMMMMMMMMMIIFTPTSLLCICLYESYSQARSQDFCKGGTRRWRDRRSRARRGGAKRRSAKGVGSGEGRRSPSPLWGSGGCPQKIFEKSTLKLHIFVWF